MVDTLGTATADGRHVDPRTTIDVLNARAWDRLQADVQTSTALAEEALAYAEGLGYDKGVADARRTLCAGHVIQSEHEQALSELPAVRELYRSLGDRRGEGSVVNILGSAYGTLGDFPKALELFLDGLSIATELGDQRGEAVALGNIGQVYAELGDLASGIEHTERALELRRAERALRPVEIEARLLIAQPNMSRLLDRMIGAGLVTREPCADDRRGHEIGLTETGHALLHKMWPVYRAAIQRHVGARLSEGETEALAVALGRRLARDEPVS